MRPLVFFYRWSLGQKLTVTFTVGVLAVAALVGVITVQNTKMLLETELKKQGVIIAAHLSHRTVPFLLAGETWSLYKSVKDTVRPAENENPASRIVKYAMVLNEKMEILAHSQPEQFRIGDIFDPGPLNETGLKARGVLIQPMVSKEGEPIYEVTQPILYEGNRLGLVRIGITQLFMIQSLQRITHEILLTTLILASVAALLGLVISRRITRPLRQLSAVAQGIAKGHFTTDMNIVIKERDEVGILAETFNQMTDALKDKVGELRNTKEYLESLLEVANDFIYTLDHEGRFSYVNAKFADWGYSKEDLIGQIFTCIVSDKYAGQSTQDILRETHAHLHEIETKDKQGNVRTVLVSTTSLRSREEQITGILGIAKDVTFMKEMERHLFDCEKLASTGALMISLGHEINNPLGIIHGFVQELEEVLQERSCTFSDDVGQTARNQVRIIQEEVLRCQRVVSNLLEFARPSPPKRELTNIGDLLDRCLRLISPLAKKKRVKCELYIEDNMPPVFLDAHQFQQVMVNLCLNALDAMAHGGKLRIAASLEAGDVIVPAISKTDVLPQHVVIAVSDTGHGVAQEDMGHIFEAFFSKGKTDKQGTGLGLFLSKQIIESHGGVIEVQSVLEEGTNFRISVPVLESADAELVGRS